ncbi:SGNH/GDSL hydrolase family protein [Pseudoduganella plicata]|uniref:SGNH/GDSL hydrolase family protein n=1 Tax=Pseudoduganella plicata TaxID=321984 RepID=A0A4P7BDQ6_9BURK|nr:SGNH/GDSL hydrolase family protein [Pseudoduganella plicata]QBQ36202.1 SGNH/GDSL hydrolase family protein [Pseudoduganella plicata]GGY77236.1 hypothetical protein GCM10007388_07510 [Pseudoduganella plicata]
MTIRLLTKWSDYEANTIITESPETEAGLLAAKLAMAELAGGVFTAKNKPTAIRVTTSRPSKRPDVHRSAMYIGDSISAATISMAHLPRHKAVRWMTAATPNLNTDGSFVKEVLTAATCPSGNGTLRYYAADSTMTWQAFGDTEGPRVSITIEACFYRIDSGTGGKEVYLALIPRWKPTVDRADTFNVSGTIKLRNNCASNGVVGWTNTLLGNPYDVIYPFCISSIRAADWWDARAQWQDIYTDDSHIVVCTNDVNSRETALQALINLENIVRSRQDIGSNVAVGCLLPYDDRTAAMTQAAVEFNIGVRAMADRLGLGAWDAWPYVGLTTGSGGYAPGMSADKLHPSSKGGYIIAKHGPVPLLAKRVRQMFAKPFSGAAYDPVNAPYGSFLVNGQLAGAVTVANAGISGEVPTGWTVVREVGSTITAVSKAPASAGAVPLPDNMPGFYWSVAVSNANASAVNGEGIRMRPSALITGFAIGTYVSFEGEIRISGTGIQAFSIIHSTQGGLAPTSMAIDQGSSAATQTDNLDGDVVRIPFRSAPMLVEAGATSMSVGIILLMNIGGTATIELSPVGLGLHPVSAPA